MRLIDVGKQGKGCGRFDNAGRADVADAFGGRQQSLRWHGRRRRRGPTPRWISVPFQQHRRRRCHHWVWISSNWIGDENWKGLTFNSDFDWSQERDASDWNWSSALRNSSGLSHEVTRTDLLSIQHHSLSHCSSSSSLATLDMEPCCGSPGHPAPMSSFQHSVCQKLDCDLQSMCSFQPGTLTVLHLVRLRPVGIVR